MVKRPCYIFKKVPDNKIEGVKWYRGSVCGQVRAAPERCANSTLILMDMGAIIGKPDDVNTTN